MGAQELLIVLAILLLFFGAKKLPGLAGSLGTSIKEVCKATETEVDETGAMGSSRAERDATCEPDPVDSDVER
jgi:sec-independent protein translocase protein TatA